MEENFVIRVYRADKIAWNSSSGWLSDKAKL